jgi:hypothetical protein
MTGNAKVPSHMHSQAAVTTHLFKEQNSQVPIATYIGTKLSFTSSKGIASQVHTVILPTVLSGRVSHSSSGDGRVP